MDNKKNGIPKLRFPGFTGAWEQRKLGEVVERFDNLRIPVTSSKREKGITPYYGANGIQDYVQGYTHDGEFVLVAEDGANDLQNYPVHYVNGKVWVNNHAHVLQGKKDIADNLFLVNAIKRIKFETYLVGGSRAKLNADVMMKLPIKVPTLNEQQKLGKYFSRIDSLIALHQRKLEHLQEQKKGLLQKMFPKNGETVPEVRFPGFTDAWEQRKLGEVVERRIEKRRQSERYPRLAFASGQGVIPLSERKTNNREQLTKDEFTKKYLVTELDDIVYNPANVKYGAIDRNKYGRGLISPIYVTFTTEEVPGFIERIVKSHDFKQKALRFEEGTVTKRQSVNPEDLVTINILVASQKKEQKKISLFFDNIDTFIALHQRKLEHLELMKKGLLQQMFV
ncbi:restriction endonuclease subunit S [Ligilactobacillus salivarius]|uniref:Type I restriction-modification system, specificity subunit S n=2 Tax=Ligilactobacillus salivarius TaxID=1624 RepID=A0A089QDU1_9LACO|nr:restriction endonuclease subunit S [Ligilactobacillus salivarius]AIR09933.1 Type I restriction-modification system, specificity subunit S [Ligilactobacillus salivarius]